MAQFKSKKTYAEKHFDRCERLRGNGVKPIPLEAYRTDHHRVDDAWRHRKSKDGWRGAKGKTKLRRGPSQPNV